MAARYVIADGSFASAIEPLAAGIGEIRVMRPAEYQLRADLAPLLERGLLREIPHEDWLTSRDGRGQAQL